jgi:Carboxypeptidase regulatory-like domain
MPRGALFVFLSFALLPALYAQEFRGTVTGRVVDVQSAAVPNARIVAVLVATGGQSVTNSGLDGLFTIPFLAPGTYRLEADAPGFKKYIRENLAVDAGERMALDIQLQVGQQTESITVTADASMLDTTTATAG